MIAIRSLAPRVLEIEMSGTLIREDIQKVEARLKPLLESEGPIGLVIHFERFEDMTADAMAEDIPFELSLLPHLARFRKVAIVAQKQAIAALVRVADRFLPMMEARVFRPEEADAARDFAKDLDEAPDDAAPPGVRLLDSGSPAVVAYEIDGWISSGDADKLFEPLEAVVKRQGWVDLLLRWRNFTGFDPRLLADPDLWAHKAAAVQSVRRYALVGAPAWITAMAERMSPLMQIEIRAFDSDREAEAWDWVRAP